MSEASPEQDASPGKLARGGELLTWPFRGRRRQVLGFVLLAAACGGAAWWLWSRYGNQVASHPSYQLDAERIEFAPSKPEWIQADVRREIMGLLVGKGESVSLLDRQLAPKLYDACSLHPWIAKVERVSKRASGVVRVEVAYRRPVAMVEVAYGEGKRGLLPVDEQAVLLPTADFDFDATKSYLRIFAEGASPTGAVGEPWQDHRIKDAARIAAQVEGIWQELKLYRVVALPSAGRAAAVDSPPQFELQSRRGDRVLWGSAPGRESSGELPAAEKAQRLKAHAADRSGGAASAAASGTPWKLDLRRPSGATPVSLPAASGP